MSDLIDRQAAIDAFTDEIQVTGRANAESVKAYVKLVVDRIKRLPSEQPDYIMTEWCTDCKEYDHEKHCCPRFNKVIRTALQDAQPEIIRCCKCGFWDRDTLRHQFNDFRDWNEAECKILAERDPYHEINRYTEADDFCSYAERREE